jgi:hypothetical protein
MYGSPKIHKEGTPAPKECQPRVWKRYVDDILAIVKRGKADDLQQHMNKVDATNSIKFTREEEVNRSIPFLDTCIIVRENQSIKTTVYRKQTHTDQYLHFSSHHPCHQKLGVVRTLMHRCHTIISEESDKQEERDHLSHALKICGYPNWAVARGQTRQERKKKQQEKSGKKYFGQVVIPYVQ